LLETIQKGEPESRSAEPPAVAVEAELERLLSSPLFASAARQKEFLRYTVQETLAGRGDKLKEYAIGVAVFRRGADFDSRLDPIVRVEARKLRCRLEKYYSENGRRDAIRIELPKGGYIPVFRPALLSPESIGDTPAPGQADAPSAEAPGVKDPGVTEAIGGNSRVLRLAILAAALLFTIVSGLYVAQRSRHNQIPEKNPAIAVLPFQDVGDNPGDSSFSEGLTDEIIDSLSRVPGLRVVARSSSFQYRNKVLDVREIGRRLNAGKVLEGTVRRDGDHLRITIQLEDTSNGYSVWSQSYDRGVSDAFALQQEISAALAKQLGLEFAPRAAASGAESTPGDPPVHFEAYQDYLRGRYFWNKVTAEGIRTSMVYFERALASDPGYAPAFAGLARSWVGMAIFGLAPASVAIPKIRAAASRALELDPSLGEAHIDQATAATYVFDWTAAEKEFRRGLELSPNDQVGRKLFCLYLIKVGRVGEALAESLADQEANPVSPDAVEGVAGVQYNSHQYDEAIEQSRKALALDSNFGLTHKDLGLIYVVKGSLAQGIAELETAQRLMKGDPLVAGLLGYSWSKSGDTARAQNILAELLRTNPAPALPIATVYMGLGKQDLAFRWLNQAVDEKAINFYPKSDPLYDSLRADSRFPLLLRRMNLQ
jgi:TolB-like protein/tetratricopeptide (TPR) repeat protein